MSDEKELIGLNTAIKIAELEQQLADLKREKAELEENINIKADWIEKTINDMAAKDVELEQLKSVDKAALVEKGKEQFGLISAIDGSRADGVMFNTDKDFEDFINQLPTEHKVMPEEPTEEIIEVICDINSKSMCTDGVPNAKNIYQAIRKEIEGE